MNMAELAPQQHRRRTGRNRLCTCRPSITISYVSIWTFQLFLDRKTRHSTGCSLHTDTTTWSVGVRALSPRIQAMLGLQFGGWSLSMVGKISPHNVVDPLKSPAFVAVSDAWREVVLFKGEGHNHERVTRTKITIVTCNGLTVPVYKGSPLDVSYQRHIESICTTLRTKLLQAFTSGKASPADRAPYGDTVFSMFLRFADSLNGYQEALFDLLNSIVETLIPNDISSNPYPQQTLLLSMMWSATASIRLRQLRMDGILISHGFDEISDECRSFLGCSPLVGIFNKYPCLLENYGQNPVHLAIRQRSEPKLSELLDLGKVDMKVDNPPLSALATGWPTGLEMLLNAGAEPSGAIVEAILQQQLQSIGLLLDHGCAMFGLIFGPHQDLLGFAVDYRASPDVLLLLIEKLVGRRKELLQLALDHLPEAVLETSWCSYHSQPRPLLDYNAIEIYDQLEAHCVEVPEALWPGPYTTIYHSRSVYENSSLAEKLYELDFRDIDKSDDQGTTPLIEAIKTFGLYTYTMDCPQLIQWLLGMGVTLDPQPFLTHVLSQSTRFSTMTSAGVWISHEQKLYGMLEIFCQLIHGASQKNDDCRCWCSTTGCTPVGVVLRIRSLSWLDDTRAFQLLRRRRWLYLLPRYSSLGLDLEQNCFIKICRLEIFDRLGMAHTCCERLDACPLNDFPITSDEFKEFQEEDHMLKKVLDLYLELYLDLLQQHQASFESFWISWWFAVDHLLPFDRLRKFDEQLVPLHLPRFPEDELWSEAQDVTGYSPDITALTSAVDACVRLLNPRAIETFLDQLKAVSLEKSFYQQTIFKPVRGVEQPYVRLA